jgi:hypothetical protein
VLHEGAEAVLSEKLPTPEAFVANVESFLRTCWLWQAGQVISVFAELLSTNTSKDLAQSLH